MAIDATAAAGGGGEKRHRVDEQAVAADAIPADRISALPDELRQRILTHLALKDAIRTGAVARGWRNLWRTRWEHRASVEVHLCSRDDTRRELDALEREPRRRLDRFSLIVESSKLKPPELRRLTEYTAECGVEDLHVELRKTTVAHKLTFRLPLCSPLLARLSLRRINISSRCYNGARPFRALEVIRLHSIYFHHAAFNKMMELCPSLLTLYLRDCNCGSCFYLLMPPSLRSVTIANCVGMASIILRRQHERCLRSFRYIGDFVRAPFSLPRDAVLADLYIRFAHPVSEQDIINKKLKSSMSSMSLPQDLSGLNVLTICCNVLPVASSLTDDGANAQLRTLNLHNLRELQLLMSEMEAANLADIYVFLKICQCPTLERLFVQLPALSYKPMEGSIDEVREEPPEDGLDNLLTVKVMNFNWRHAEVQLVSFLLRKASSLQKLLIVSSNVAPLDLPGVQADLLLLKKALANGKIILSEADDAATQPYHSDF